MGISRKDALRQIKSIKPIIQGHLDKMRTAPFAIDYNHWRVEVEGWIRDVEFWATHVGRRTQEEVMRDVKEWKNAAGLEDD